MWRFGFLVSLPLCLLGAAPPDSRDIYKWLDKGKKLSPRQADDLEGRVNRKPLDPEARVQLIAYYTAEPIEANRAPRSRHILAVLRGDPAAHLGLSPEQLRINCAGDPLADRAAFAQALPLWLDHAAKDIKLVKPAADAIEYCAPEEAEKLLLVAGNQDGLGRLYARSALGAIGEAYGKYEASGSDPAFRQTPFAQRAKASLEQAAAESKDKDFLAGAAAGLLSEGGRLWADGKLDWDYTPLGKPLLAAARKLGPGNLRLLTLSAELPARGERPPMTIRVGGNVASANLVRQAKPEYPAAARKNGIQGTVRMTALIGLDGRILGLELVSGPPELVDASVSAVRMWEYKPTLLNGKPCFVMTLIDVNYVLGAGL